MSSFGPLNRIFSQAWQALHLRCSPNRSESVDSGSSFYLITQFNDDIFTLNIMNAICINCAAPIKHWRIESRKFCASFTRIWFWNYIWSQFCLLRIHRVLKNLESRLGWFTAYLGNVLLTKLQGQILPRKSRDWINTNGEF